MDKSLTLSVILPAYNEEGNIERTLLEVIAHLEKKSEPYKVVVFNDGSVRRTGELVSALSYCSRRMILVNHPENQGYGYAVRSGFNVAYFDCIFMMDSD